MAEPIDHKGRDAVHRHMGQRLRQRREAMGWSIDEAAGQAGISPARLSAYEAGEKRIPAAALVRLTVSLQVDIDWPFRGEPSQATAAERPQGPASRALKH